MNNERIQEIKERQDAATSGSWQAEGKEIWRRGESYTANIGGHVWIADVDHAGNRGFIAHAPDDIAYLLSEVERLQEENNAMKEALQWYADDRNYKLGNQTVLGEMARTALSHLKGE
ncbi:hypothetical protein D3C74_224140 [compost metagenome]